MSETLKRAPCQTCGSPGFYFCDYPVQRGGVGCSCGRIMCKAHAARVAGVAHYCPPHDRASRAPVVNAPDRPRVPGFEE
jgi:hypothetical protein